MCLSKLKEKKKSYVITYLLYQHHLLSPDFLEQYLLGVFFESSPEDVALSSGTGDLSNPGLRQLLCLLLP